MTATPRSSPIHVVIADDTPEMRDVVRMFLEEDDRFQVVGEAGNGREAVDVVAARQPDVVLLDLAMPVMDGLQAAREMKQIAPSTRIVVMSGFNAGEMSAEALASGADIYLEKGVGLKDLALVITTLCGQPLTAASRSPRSAGPRARADVAATDTPMEELVSTLAHELRTPVTVARYLVARVRASADRTDPEFLAASMDALERNLQAMEDLVQALLDAAALEGGSLTLTLKDVDVGVLVRQTVDDLAPVLEPHRVRTEIAESVIGRVDPARTRQVVANLLTNAAKFSASDDPIDVRVALVGEKVEIVVADHGPGIPADRVDEVFRKHARLQPYTTGLGLGLYVSRGIARAHGGDLRLESSSPAGARFVLALPASTAPAAPDERVARDSRTLRP